MERYISGVVESSETRLTKLIHAWRAACYILGEIKEKLGAASEIIRADSELLSGLETACRIQQERTLKKVEPLFEAFDHSFVAAGLQAEPLLNSEFRILSALMPHRTSARDIEGLVFATTMKAVRRSVGAGADAVQEDVSHLWDRVTEEMQEHFNLELSVGKDGKPDWTLSHDRIEKRVEEATVDVLQGLRLKEELGKQLSRRSQMVWLYVFGAVMAMIVGVTMSMLHWTPWNAVSFGVGAIFLFLGALTGARSVRKIHRFYSDTLERHRETISTAQRNAFQEATSEFYRDFIKLFEPLRKVCRKHREKYEPQIKGIVSTEKNLAELERILTPVEKAIHSNGK